MPFTVRKRSCTNSEGKKGSYVVINANTGKAVSCHMSQEAAQAAARIRNAESEDLNLENYDVKQIIEDAKRILRDAKGNKKDRLKKNLACKRSG